LIKLYLRRSTCHASIAAALLMASKGVVSDVAQAAPPRPDHVVVVIEENHSYDELLGSDSVAPYIKSLAAAGANFTSSFAVEHPSQPNYLDLFSGANQGRTGTDTISTSTPFTTANLGAQLRAAGFSFAGYSETLPTAGSLVTAQTIGSLNGYVRKHNPWSNWQASSPTANQLPASTNQPFTAFPTSFSSLPTVSFVIPNEQNDMHDGTIQQGDSWLQTNLQSYYEWAQLHNSMLIVTVDEDDSSESNQIATVFDGPMIKTGAYSETINHFSVLRTIEDMYGLSHIGSAASASTITDAFYSQSRTWLAGDSNFDGTVSITDFNQLAGNFGKTGMTWMKGDFNGDGIVNSLDLNAIATNFGQTSPLPGVALGALVPEPAAGAAIGLILTLCTRRRRQLLKNRRFTPSF
jgi:phosphatidylinositol-3-phosphatase